MSNYLIQRPMGEEAKKQTKTGNERQKLVYGEEINNPSL
jgi:hypothetical protein